MNVEDLIGVLTHRKTLPADAVPNSLKADLFELGLEPKNARYDIQAIELLNADLIKSRLNQAATRWLEDIEITSAIGSTNTELVSRGQKRDIHGCVLAAEVQLAGRGRRGRNWISPFGQNIAMSLGTNLDTPPTQIGSVSLVVGLAVAHAIESLGDVHVQLKWPNDVLLDGKKVAGILIELIDASQPARLVIGVGINVRSAPGREVTGDYSATCLSDHLSSCLRNDVSARLIEQIVTITQEFERRGLQGFIDDWEQRDYLKNRLVTLSGGSTDVIGTALGIDKEGAYLIQTDNDIHRAIGGDLSLRAKQN